MAHTKLIFDEHEPSRPGKAPIWNNIENIVEKRDYRDWQRFNDACLLLQAVMTKCEHEIHLLAIGDEEAYARFLLLMEDIHKAQHELLRTLKCISFITLI